MKSYKLIKSDFKNTSNNQYFSNQMYRYCCTEVHSNTVIKNKDIRYSKIKKEVTVRSRGIYFSLGKEVRTLEVN